MPRQSSIIRLTQGRIEITLPPRSPLPHIRTLPNCTHVLPSRDIIGTASADTTITDTDLYNDQRPMGVVVI